LRLVLFAISAGLLILSPPRDSIAIARVQENRAEYIAFRVDDRHVVAVVGNDDVPDEHPGREPIATLGFKFRAADPSTVRPEIAAIRQWVVHLSPGRHVMATTDHEVQGSAACTGMRGVLLRIDDPQQMFLNTREKYYVAEPLAGALPPSRARLADAGSIDREQIETLLRDVLMRELPGVQAEAKDEIDRLATGDVGYHRTWARRRLQIDEALASGKARLQYDVQGFPLDPSGAPLYFVRAEWRAGGGQAFGAALWIRGGSQLSIVRQDLNPARWLRMFEFQGEISRELYGMVLNFVDRDRDGWGEIVFANGGYESMAITLIELTPGGFESTGIGYNYGC
jgi:hypothetical protein